MAGMTNNVTFDKVIREKSTTNRVPITLQVMLKFVFVRINLIIFVFLISEVRLVHRKMASWGQGQTMSSFICVSVLEETLPAIFKLTIF